MTYTIELLDAGWHIVLDDGKTLIGPYVNEYEAEHEVERLTEHIAAGAWAGKPR